MLGDGVDSMLYLPTRCSLDLAASLRVTVIEHLIGAERLDKVEVFRGAETVHLEVGGFGYLYNVEADCGRGAIDEQRDALRCHCQRRRKIMALVERLECGVDGDTELRALLKRPRLWQSDNEVRLGSNVLGIRAV